MKISYEVAPKTIYCCQKCYCSLHRIFKKRLKQHFSLKLHTLNLNLYILVILLSKKHRAYLVIPEITSVIECWWGRSLSHNKQKLIHIHTDGPASEFEKVLTQAELPRPRTNLLCAYSIELQILDRKILATVHNFMSNWDKISKK